MYDNNSDIFGFIYNDTEYYYIKNAQNDVIAIADTNGNILVKYAYDAWGKVISVTDKNGHNVEDLKANKFDLTTGETITEYDENGNVIEYVPIPTRLANLNPILYRSYYYDKETEWYYLNTRYYSPDMCRFINADGIIQTGQGMLDKNMFAYCLNNPVNYKDDNGKMSRKDEEDYIFISVLIIAIVSSQSHQSPTSVSVSISKDSQSKVNGSVKVIDKRKKGSKKDNNFEVVDSYRITNKIDQLIVCQTIIDYNKENPDDSGWDRDIVTMIVEWDWHNRGYENNLFTTHTDSVNFDMGTGTNSTYYSVQIAGYGYELIKPYVILINKNSSMGTRPCMPF